MHEKVKQPAGVACCKRSAGLLPFLRTPEEPAFFRVLSADIGLEVVAWKRMLGSARRIRSSVPPIVPTGDTLRTWAEKHNITHIQPGNPQQNPYIERYKRTVRRDGYCF